MAVYSYLKSNFGGVRLEEDWVDLKATVDGQLTYFEVKAASTAKRCIREGLGQLLEYAHYPDRRRPLALVIVGDAELLEEDEAYLHLLGTEYGLDIDYAQFDWSKKALVGW